MEQGGPIILALVALHRYSMCLSLLSLLKLGFVPNTLPFHPLLLPIGGPITNFILTGAVRNVEFCLRIPDGIFLAQSQLP